MIGRGGHLLSAEAFQPLLRGLVGGGDGGGPARSGKGLGFAAEQLIGCASIVVGVHIFRIELARLGIVGDRAVVVPLGRMGFAASVERVKIFGVQADRFVEVRDGAVMVTLLVITAAAK